jgi:uracil-DNA glycosylase
VSSEQRAEKLTSLARGICRCRKCPLHENRTHAVPGEGPPDAEVMVIGEAPGQKEDAQGRPFVGRSGNFLNKVFADLGIRRQRLFITASVKCRPPENRNPTDAELDRCRDAWLEKQIACIQPRRIVPLGATAIRSILGLKPKIRDVHGQTREQGGRQLLLTYHPTAAMRFGWIEARFREDLSRLEQI